MPHANEQPKLRRRKIAKEWFFTPEYGVGATIAIETGSGNFEAFDVVVATHVSINRRD